MHFSGSVPQEPVQSPGCKHKEQKQTPHGGLYRNGTQSLVFECLAVREWHY